MYKRVSAVISNGKTKVTVANKRQVHSFYGDDTLYVRREYSNPTSASLCRLARYAEKSTMTDITVNVDYAAIHAYRMQYSTKVLLTVYA